MAKPLSFKFSGDISPEQLRYAVRPVEPVPYRMDLHLLECITKHTSGKRGSVGSFMEKAVEKFVIDLDSVLMAAIECRSRQDVYSVKPTTAMIGAEIGNALTQAAEFLKAKGYKRLGRGGIMVACALLLADDLKLLPSVEEEEKQLQRDGKKKK